MNNSYADLKRWSIKSVEPTLPTCKTHESEEEAGRTIYSEIGIPNERLKEFQVK